MADTVKISNSTNKDKKYMAVFYKDNKKIKTTHFGANGMEDYTIHKDILRKNKYINRHKKNESWNNPLTAGALSRWILWEKPNLNDSLKYYSNKFNIKVINNI